MLKFGQLVWFSHFKRVEMSIEDKLRSSHISMTQTEDNVEKID